MPGTQNDASASTADWLELYTFEQFRRTQLHTDQFLIFSLDFRFA
jgi:hypothetical protein